MSIELHWNGVDGSAFFDGRYAVLSAKPVLAFNYDTLSFTKDAFARRP